MKKTIAASVVLLACFSTFAEPEIKGTLTDLTHFISLVPQTVMITGEAEVRVPAHRAMVSLKVVTENKSLQEAMRANLDLRGKLTEFLESQGIPAERITASKFSSTPKFGLFGDKAKSYRLENQVRVLVQDEKEFQAAAGAVDKWSEVQFNGVEFEYADKAAQKQSAIAKACDNAGEQKKIYEEKLGLKLQAARLYEGQVAQRNASVANGFVSPISSGLKQYDSAGAEESATSFGEIVYTARIAVEYTVQTK